MACCIGSRLANSIVNALNLPNLRITFRSDSTTALWWIKEKGSWSVFVENRVKEIRQLTRGHLWKHVPGNLNIADLLSRGCSPQQMLISRWWEGPLWLRESPEYWPLGETPGDSEEVELERKKLKVVNIDLSRDAPPWHLYAISDYNKMIRTFSWILRCFIARRGRPRTIFCDNGTNFRGAFNDLSKLNWSKIVEETRTPKILWKFIPPTAAWWGGWWERLVRTVKELFFKAYFGPLTYVSENPEELIPLTPSMFLISNKNSNIEDIEELNSNSLNKRIKYRRRDCKIRTVRLKTQHGKMLRPIQRIYPLEIRSNENLQRVCCRYRATTSKQLMGDLPTHRVTPSRPFSVCGVDYAGPINILRYRGRGAKTTKGYIALFVCFATKALHLELVSDLTSEAFIASLKRFCAKRGAPKHIYCDNGTTFVGARRKLQEIFKFV
ncbi:integrase catalytic domain-containing protein [Trichonephila clavipes]|nr:integrase catalytic domain-containing protein [Trichonephila clavipes]